MERYDPSGGTFSPATPSLAFARYSHTATQLTDGRVLFVGGEGAASVLGSAEIYDPAAGTVSTTGSLNTPRTAHAAVLLSGGSLAGQVLIIGGLDATNTPLTTMELYDPGTGAFSLLPATLASGRANLSATVIPDGRVVIAGGNGSTQVEAFQPVSGTVAVIGSMLQARQFHTATLLPGSRVLFVGGAWNGQLAGAEVCDLSQATPTFTATGNMAVPRMNHSATVLPSGIVLVAGGGDIVPPSFSTTASAELFDPASLQFFPTGSLLEQLQNHTATLLPDGTVLITGGYDYLHESQYDAEIYQ
jgi:hypothetical protein